ncbi:MAG: Hpt domain-containing protein [Pseudobacteriovorax sp.]|nr:Hpt domain-containing protein [Pseudobacteriovorax sp.]
MSFFTSSIRWKIVSVICSIIFFSQALTFLSTFWQVRSSAERGIQKGFEQTELLVSNIFANLSSKLRSQAQLVGKLPVLMAVVDADDEETVVDSELEYQRELELDFFDVIAVDGYSYGDDEESPTWDPRTFTSIRNAIDSQGSISGFAVRNDKLVYVAANIIGTEENLLGYLLLGTTIDDALMADIAKLSKTHVTFLKQDQIVASSVSRQKEGDTFTELETELNKYMNSEIPFRTWDYIYQRQPQPGIDGNNLVTLVIQSSLSESNALFLNLVAATSILALLIILVFSFAASKIAKTISEPIRVLESTAKAVISSLDFSKRVEVKGEDEVSSLSESFNGLLAEIEENHEKLKDYSKNLELKVEERTATINMILNNVSSGFCLVDKNMAVEDGYTKSCQSIVGEQFRSGIPLAACLKMDERAADHFKTCFIQVFDDIMPEEVTLRQAPSSVTIGEKTIGISARVIRDGDGTVSKLLFSISDISELKAAQKQNRINESLLKILQHKDAFISFLKESKEMIEEAETLLRSDTNDDSRIRIILHTIKGNCGAMGLMELADLIHHIEDKETIELSHLNQISDHLGSFVKSHDILDIDFEELSEPGTAISMEQIDRLHQSIGSTQTLEEAKNTVSIWIGEIKKVRASSVFATVGDLVQRVSDRLMKPVVFSFEGADTLVDPDRFKALAQTLPHVIRNCMDHGLEEPYERGEKSEEGHLTLVVDEESSHWHVKIKDDGRGINTDKLVEKSLANGILSREEIARMSHNDKLRLIFRDGLSTVESVSDVSGRGVGMAAVLQAVEEAGGNLHLESEMGVGTSFDFTIPKTDKKAS